MEKSSSIRSLKAFTLVEMVLVISVIVVLAVLAGPAVGPMMRGSQLTRAGISFSEQLGFARQLALAKNRTMEVRFYQFSDVQAGEPADSPTNGKYRAMQIFEIQPSGAAAAVSTMTSLPPTVIMDSGNTLSTLLNRTPIQSGAQLKQSIPRAGTTYNCVKFQFLPDGSTDLSPTLQWFVTLHSITNGNNLATPPTNFYTLQIDPVNGKASIYHP